MLDFVVRVEGTQVQSLLCLTLRSKITERFRNFLLSAKGAARTVWVRESSRVCSPSRRLETALAEPTEGRGPLFILPVFLRRVMTPELVTTTFQK